MYKIVVSLKFHILNILHCCKLILYSTVACLAELEYPDFANNRNKNYYFS